MTEQPRTILPTAGPEAQPRHVLIVGGGASGVLMAAHLLAQDSGTRVTLIERRDELGCGVAYSTQDPEHLLNTRVQHMSAFPDDPAHFGTWLARRSGNAAPDAQAFVSRSLYGAYLADLLPPTPDRRLQPIRGECLRLEETADGIVAHLSDGRQLPGDVAVLATGHALPDPEPGAEVSAPWTKQPVDPDARVLLIGSGLTMVDQVVALLAGGHRGEIVAVSRRGLLPRPHSPTAPLKIVPGDVPLGAPLSHYLRWLRALAARAEAEGGTWRDAVDGVRPHVRAIWQSLDRDQRRRFLRHGAGWWDVHRHRMPPSSWDRLARGRDAGQVRFLRASFSAAERQPDGSLVAHLVPREVATPERLDCGIIIDCRGILRDPERHATPLVASLLAEGRARIDPLRIGLEVTRACRLIGRNGSASTRLFAIGPVSRATFWEITAIPDIREQVAALSVALSGGAIDLAD